MAEIKNLNPVEIWRNFDKLTQVPRPSGHLEKIQAYLLIKINTHVSYLVGCNNELDWRVP